MGGAWARTGLPAALAAATYDAANRITAWGGTGFIYDLNGNLTGDGTTTYVWNARDQLTGLSGATTASFTYDARGRRRGKTVSGTTNFLFDDSNVVQELSGSTPTANLLTGLDIDETWTRTDGSGTNTLLTDALRSTLALAGASGTIQTQYTFEPFGATTVSGAAITNSQQYTGRENDATGLYYYRARYYSPTLDRFVSEDPKYSPTFLGSQCKAADTPNPSQYSDLNRGFAPILGLGFAYASRLDSTLNVNPQRMHLYTYTENDPIDKTDPTGLVAAPQIPGCDRIGNWNPCMTKCCDEHDKCYERAESWCDESSWREGRVYRPECRDCNLAALRCIARSFIPGRRKDCGK